MPRAKGDTRSTKTIKPTAVVVTCFDPTQPGFLDFSYRLYALSKTYALTVIGRKNTLLNNAELLTEGAQYLETEVGHGKIGWLRYLKNCASRIRQLQPDLVVLLHSAAAPITLMIKNIPTILYWNEHPTNLIQTTPKMWLMRRLLNKSLHGLIYHGAKNADLVMPIGEDHADDLIAHGVNKAKLKMIYMGVSDRFLLAAPTEQPINHCLKLIYTGTVNTRRGRDVMLEAMHLLAKDSVPLQLTLVGASEAELATTNQKIKQLGLTDTVKVIGRVSGEEIHHYLLNQDVGICIWEKNSAYEFNPPTKLFEYLVAGLPILASNSRTHKRYIDEQQNGWIFEYNAEALANAIRKIWKDKHLISQYKAQARQAGSSYLWSAIEPEFLRATAGVIR